MQKERNIITEDLKKVIKFLNENNIEKGDVLRTKKSRKDGKEYILIYFNYLDLYVVNENFFSRQLKAIDYFNKL